MKFFVTLIAFSLLINSFFGQVGNIPLQFSISQEVNIHESNLNERSHQAIKPFCRQFQNQKAFEYTFIDSTSYYYNVMVKLYQQSLLQIDKGDVHLTADPLIIYYQGKSDAELRGDISTIKNNTRGLRVTGDIGKNVSFETKIYENQFFLPHYLDSIVNRRNASFGLGRTKPFKDFGFDVGYSSGYVAVKISNNINVQFGHDKIFIGHGYRSLFISDNSSNYPLLKVNWQSSNKKWAYQNVNAWMQSLERLPNSNISPESIFKRKGATFRYLSFKPNNHWEIGLFEGVIHENYVDSLGKVPLNVSFYTPIIGVGTALNGLQGKNNALLGINSSFFFKNHQIFGQLALDDKNKLGYQIGFKWFEPLYKKDWLHIEFNSASKYMYSHQSDFLLQNYSHMNQELAHPIGASFKEVIGKYHFELNHWFSNATLIYSSRKRLEGSLQGELILLANDIQNALLNQYENVNTSYWNLEFGYQFNIKTRLQLFGGVTGRYQNYSNGSRLNQNETFWTIGIRTHLNNFYHDI